MCSILKNNLRAAQRNVQGEQTKPDRAVSFYNKKGCVKERMERREEEVTPLRKAWRLRSEGKEKSGRGQAEQSPISSHI